MNWYGSVGGGRSGDGGPADGPDGRLTVGSGSTSRLEAFSDGVFAVAITLLALGLTVPPVEQAHEQGLAAALLAQWPVYLAYVLSFLNILIMWINHHRLFQFVRRTDEPFLALNGLLLLVVCCFPFATLLLATYLHQPVQADRTTAAVVYCGLALVLGLIFNALWLYATRGGRLLAVDADAHLVRTTTRQYVLGPPVYFLALVLALWRVELSIGLALLLSIVFLVPTSLTRSKPATRTQ